MLYPSTPSRAKCVAIYIHQSHDINNKPYPDAIHKRKKTRLTRSKKQDHTAYSSSSFSSISLPLPSYSIKLEIQPPTATAPTAHQLKATMPQSRPTPYQ